MPLKTFAWRPQGHAADFRMANPGTRSGLSQANPGTHSGLSHGEPRDTQRTASLDRRHRLLPLLQWEVRGKVAVIRNGHYEPSQVSLLLRRIFRFKISLNPQPLVKYSRIEAVT